MRTNGGRTQQWTQLPAQGEQKYTSDPKCSRCSGVGYMGTVTRMEKGESRRFALWCSCARVSVTFRGGEFVVTREVA